MNGMLGIKGLKRNKRGVKHRETGKEGSAGSGLERRKEIEDQAS